MPLAFCCFKTTTYGLKIGVLGSAEDPAAKRQLKVVLRAALDVDGRHYCRLIINVGPKTKLLVGRPLV